MADPLLFKKQVLGGAGTGLLPQLARWLINDHASITGPGWKIIEAYDDDCPTTKLRQPTSGDENNMDNAAFSLNSDFGWHLDSLGTKDWIVLESLADPAYQVVFGSSGSTSLYYCMLPYGDFTPGMAAVSPPSYTNGGGMPPASRVLYYNTAYVTITGWNHVISFDISGTYYAFADEDTLGVIGDSGASLRWLYIGVLEDYRSEANGASFDIGSRCIMYCAPDHVHTNDGSYWGYILSWSNSPEVPIQLSSNNMESCSYHGPVDWSGEGGLTSEVGISPVYLFMQPLNLYEHSLLGRIKNLYSVSGKTQGTVSYGRGTLDGRSYAFFVNTAYHQAVAFKWDGSTDIP